MTRVDPAEPAGAPPPPGADTPVPVDATARAAAAGRARRVAAEAPPPVDRLVPAKALETRAEERARLRRARLALDPVGVPGASGMPGAMGMPSAVANPGAGLGPHGAMLPPGLVPAMVEAMPRYGAPVYGASAYGAPASGPGAYRMPSGPIPYGSGYYGSGPYGSGPYGSAAHGSVPHGYPAHPPVIVVPPRIAWTRRQRGAALLSSWIGQTIMALATHLFTAFAMIVGFAFLLHVSGDEVADFEADSFTSIVSLWSTPDRVWATAIIGLLIGGVILALGWLTNALWARSAGLDKPHRSTWLAYLCTTAATGLVGVVVWPIALIGALFFVLASSSASLTVGSMWSTLFSLLAVAVVLTGGVGMLFGWLFLSTARPRVDLRALADAEEAEARARDEAELARVELRGEPGPR